MNIMINRGLFVLRISEIGFLVRELTPFGHRHRKMGEYLDVPEVRGEIITPLTELEGENFTHDV
jgi:hypothetical protein